VKKKRKRDGNVEEAAQTAARALEETRATTFRLHAKLSWLVNAWLQERRDNNGHAVAVEDIVQEIINNNQPNFEKEKQLEDVFVSPEYTETQELQAAETNSVSVDEVKQILDSLRKYFFPTQKEKKRRKE
jgi:hypothetical protein